MGGGVSGKSDMDRLKRSAVAAAMGLGILGGAGLFAQPAHAEFIAMIARVGLNVVVAESSTSIC
jgi:hypothetical protein